MKDLTDEELYKIGRVAGNHIAKELKKRKILLNGLAAGINDIFEDYKKSKEG